MDILNVTIGEIIETVKKFNNYHDELRKQEWDKVVEGKRIVVLDLIAGDDYYYTQAIFQVRDALTLEELTDHISGSELWGRDGKFSSEPDWITEEYADNISSEAAWEIIDKNPPPLFAELKRVLGVDWSELTDFLTDD